MELTALTPPRVRASEEDNMKNIIAGLAVLGSANAFAAQPHPWEANLFGAFWQSGADHSEGHLLEISGVCCGQG